MKFFLFISSQKSSSPQLRHEKNLPRAKLNEKKFKFKFSIVLLRKDSEHRFVKGLLYKPACSERKRVLLIFLSVVPRAVETAARLSTRKVSLKILTDIPTIFEMGIRVELLYNCVCTQREIISLQSENILFLFFLSFLLFLTNYRLSTYIDYCSLLSDL